MIRIAYTSPFVPPEWISAHGLRPAWLPAHCDGARSAEALREGVCPFAGAVLGGLPNGLEAAALVLTTTCDQMRRAADIVGRDAPPVFLFNVPATWQTAVSRQLYCDELERLGRFLVRAGGVSPMSSGLNNFGLISSRTCRT